MTPKLIEQRTGKYFDQELGEKGDTVHYRLEFYKDFPIMGLSDIDMTDNIHCEVHKWDEIGSRDEGNTIDSNFEETCFSPKQRKKPATINEMVKELKYKMIIR